MHLREKKQNERETPDYSLEMGGRVVDFSFGRENEIPRPHNDYHHLRKMHILGKIGMKIMMRRRKISSRVPTTRREYSSLSLPPPVDSVPQEW